MSILLAEALQRADYLEVASGIGRRLADQALWEGRECTWTILSPDRESSARRQSVPKTATSELYQGASGIAAFLGELHRLSDQPKFGRTALGAIRYALRLGEDLPETSFGFHSGRPGIAYAAFRLGQILQRPELGKQALALIEPLAGKEGQDHGLDVIAGGAGAIPALLHLHSATGNSLPLDIALALGDNLMQRVHREPGGWSWGTIGNSAVRNLVGLAHGTAGIALALLELAWASGVGRYRFGAEMAFLYERSHFSPGHSNWPDLRHKEIGDLLYYGTPEDLHRAAISSQIPPYDPKYMSAWCHGSPGIGLSRLRAFELTGQAIYRREAEAALRSTAESYEGNYSLCHGIAGNCELPLMASSILDDPSLLQQCEQCAATGWERFGKPGVPWPCGTMNSESDPSLMLGEAGIGYFYLRLYEPQTPSLLLLRPKQPQEPVPDADQSFGDMRQISIREFFGQTLEAFEALQQPVQLPDRSEPPLQGSPVENAFESIQTAAGSQEGERAELLEDAFRLDRERYRLTLQVTDFTDEYLRLLTRTPVEEVDWDEATFRRADFTRLVERQFDWDGWLASDNGSAPPPGASVSLLYRRSNRIHSRPIGPLSCLILESLENPLGAGQLAEQIALQAEIQDDNARSQLAEKVMQQLRHLYQAGFVDCVKAPASRPPSDYPFQKDPGGKA